MITCNKYQVPTVWHDESLLDYIHQNDKLVHLLKFELPYVCVLVEYNAYLLSRCTPVHMCGSVTSKLSQSKAEQSKY